jgi:hypothetical protein
MDLMGFAQPLLIASLDYLSQVLQAINNGGEVNLQTALAAQVILALKLEAPPSGQAATMKNYGKAFQDLFDGLIDFGNQKESVFPRLPHLGSFKTFQKLHTVVEWVNDWPVADDRDDYLKLKTLYKVEPTRLVGGIEQSTDAIFLRRTNPVLVGKLRLSFLVLREEAGLELVNTGPHVFAMCHLYNALLQTGRIISGTETAGNMFEAISSLHMEELFLGSTFPTEAREIHIRLRLAWGTSSRFIQQGKKPLGSTRALSNSEKLTKDKWHLKTSHAIEILRDYLHGKISLIKALTSFHEIFQKGLQFREQKTFYELDAAEFLDKLLDCLQESYPRLAMDYFTAHCACTELLQTIDAAIGPTSLTKQVEPEAWGKGTQYAYAMVSHLLRDLSDAEDRKTRNRRVRSLNGEDESTSQLDLTAQIIQDYMDTNKGIGLPN